MSPFALRKKKLMPDLSALLKRTSTSDMVARAVRGFYIRSQVLTLKNLAESGQLEVGSGSYGIPEVLISHPDDRVVIGRFCSIAPGVMLIPGGVHPVDVVSTFPFKMRWDLEDVDSAVQRRGPIEICDDVWIGSRVTVLTGVTIGVGAIVAAGSVVTRDVPPYSIVAGVPSRVVGVRFDDATCRALLTSQWWTLGTRALQGLVPLLSGRDIEGLVSAVGRIRACEVPASSRELG